ncbi:hypothetical protein [Psychromicrobium sp. YIM B11713]|uniref:hypothetical protein n=1 Tax=Psychromicrobium sp. YIM B11713 TaxID=3145233 RepID=UPI00374E8466
MTEPSRPNSAYQTLVARLIRRPLLISAVLALAFALVYFTVSLGGGQHPLVALAQAVFAAIPWALIWYFVFRRLQKTQLALAREGKFQGAVRTPNALKDSLSERWAVGVITPAATGFGFQHANPTGELPEGSVSWYEVLDEPASRPLTPAEQRSFGSRWQQVRVYQTSKGAREIIATAQDLHSLESTWQPVLAEPEDGGVQRD